MGARRLQPARANVTIASARWVNVALMALFGRAAAVLRCPLLGVEQT